MKEETVTSNGSSQANVVNKGNRVLKLGLDTHYRQVTVAMQEDGGPDQGRRENAPRGFSKLGAQKGSGANLKTSARGGSGSDDGTDMGTVQGTPL